MPFLFSPTVKAEKGAFFAAMNTPKGFVSEFQQIFSPYKTYMIKGGPGTGKSTLMKRIEKEAAARSLHTVRYFCSSDSASLDGIVVKSLDLAVIDATLPHAIEPSLVGVKDRYLDTAQFLSKSLAKHETTLAALAHEKNKAYTRAYQLLAALYATDEALAERRLFAFDFEKCEKAINRLLDRLSLTGDEKPTVINAPMSAIGSEGYVTLDSYRNSLSEYIQVSDRYGVSPFFFKLLEGCLNERKISYRYSKSPLTMATDSIFIKQNKLLITSLPLPYAPSFSVNCERFLASRGQGLYKKDRSLLSAEKLLFDETVAAFRKASEAHKASERLYGEAMNFSALNTYTDALIREIFKG